MFCLTRKAIFAGHSTDHRITHFETNGVVVTGHAKPKQEPTVAALKPLTKLIN